MEIEAVELVAGLLGVGYVFIDNEGSTLGVVGDTLSNLANWAKFSEKVEQLFRSDVVTQVLYEQTNAVLLGYGEFAARATGIQASG